VVNQPTNKPAYLARKFANRFEVFEHNTLEQICQTHTIDWAHTIAAMLNERESQAAPASTHPANVATK
jgi:hypothetical protein